MGQHKWKNLEPKVEVSVKVDLVVGVRCRAEQAEDPDYLLKWARKTLEQAAKSVRFGEGENLTVIAKRPLLDAKDLVGTAEPVVETAPS